MKLSELNTDRALDVLCELTPCIYNITSDKGIVDSVSRVIDVDRKETNVYGQYLLLADRVVEILPLLLKNHRADVYGILSVLNEKPAAEIAAQPVRDTIRQVKEAFQDEELLSFFRSSARQERNAPSAPSVESPACE